MQTLYTIGNFYTVGVQQNKSTILMGILLIVVGLTGFVLLKISDKKKP